MVNITCLCIEELAWEYLLITNVEAFSMTLITQIGVQNTVVTRSGHNRVEFGYSMTFYQRYFSHGANEIS